jgi:hypothetical protein
MKILKDFNPSFFLNTAFPLDSTQLVVLYCVKYDSHKPSYRLWTQQIDKYIWMLLLFSLTFPAIFQQNIFIFIIEVYYLISIFMRQPIHNFNSLRIRVLLSFSAFTILSIYEFLITRDVLVFSKPPTLKTF